MKEYGPLHWPGLGVVDDVRPEDCDFCHSLLSGFDCSNEESLILRQVPLPIENLRHILTDLVDVVLVLHQLVVHLLDEVCTAVAQLGQMQDGILDQMEAVDLVLHLCRFLNDDLSD